VRRGTGPKGGPRRGAAQRWEEKRPCGEGGKHAVPRGVRYKHGDHFGRLGANIKSFGGPKEQRRRGNIRSRESEMGKPKAPPQRRRQAANRKRLGTLCGKAWGGGEFTYSPKIADSRKGGGDEGPEISKEGKTSTS